MMLLVLPLRIPVPCDIQKQLTTWLDQNQNQHNNHPNENTNIGKKKPSFRSSDCQPDLQYIAQLRNRIGNQLQQHGFQTVSASFHQQQQLQQQQQQQNHDIGNSNTSVISTTSSTGTGTSQTNNTTTPSTNTGITSTPSTVASTTPSTTTTTNTTTINNNNDPIFAIDLDLQEYAAILKDCEERHFPIHNMDDPYQIIKLPWKFRNETMKHVQVNTSTKMPLPTHHHHTEVGGNTATRTGDPTTTFHTLDPIEIQNNLRWERANVIWNLATLEAYKAAEGIRNSTTTILMTTTNPGGEQQSTTTTTQQTSSHHTSTSTKSSSSQKDGTTSSSHVNHSLPNMKLSSTSTIPRSAWAKAGQHLQNAANLIYYLRTEIVAKIQEPSSSSSNNKNKNKKNNARRTRRHVDHHNNQIIEEEDEDEAEEDELEENDSGGGDNDNDLPSSSQSPYLLLSLFFLELWERFCCAEAQRATYETFRVNLLLGGGGIGVDVMGSNSISTNTNTTSTAITVQQPNHKNSKQQQQQQQRPQPPYQLLAQLAAGAVPLYQKVEDMCQSNATEQLLRTCSAFYNTNTNSTNYQKQSTNTSGGGFDEDESTAMQSTNFNTGSGITSSPPIKLDAIVMDWEDTVRAWGMWLTSMTEYYQAYVHSINYETGMEITRLEAAIQFGNFCKEFVESSVDSDLLDSVAIQVMPTMEEMVERYEQQYRAHKIRTSTITTSSKGQVQEGQQQQVNDTIPEHDELAEVIPQLAVTTPEMRQQQQQEQEQDPDTTVMDPPRFVRPLAGQSGGGGGGIQKSNSDYPVPYHNHSGEESSSLLVSSTTTYSSGIRRLLPSSNRCMFVTVIADLVQREYVNLFRHELQYVLKQCTIKMLQETERGRQILASMKLPHQLIQYRTEQEQLTITRRNLLYHHRQQQKEEEQQQQQQSTRKHLVDDDDNQNRNAHSSTSSTQSLSDEVWQQIEQYQIDNVDGRMKDDLFYIKQCYEEANELYIQMCTILDEDIQMDTLFREHHQYTFTGHDVQEVQKPFRDALNNYNQLLLTATDSDLLLQKKYETTFNTDPRFRLLQLSKSQLERIIHTTTITTTASRPNEKNKMKNNGVDEAKYLEMDELDEIDVTLLSQYLVDLSLLFKERDNILHDMKERAKTYDILSAFQECCNTFIKKGGNKNQHHFLTTKYRQIIDDIKKRIFHPYMATLDETIDYQNELLDGITKENEIFTDEWDAIKLKQQQHNKSKTNNKLSSSVHSSQNKSQHQTDTDHEEEEDEDEEDDDTNFVRKIERSLEQIQLYLKHLKEGKDFYNVVIPKLNKLKQQIVEVSARLTHERSVYEKNVNSSNNNSNNNNNNNNNNHADSNTGRRLQPPPPQQQQQQQQRPGYSGSVRSSQPYGPGGYVGGGGPGMGGNNYNRDPPNNNNYNPSNQMNHPSVPYWQGGGGRGERMVGDTGGGGEGGIGMSNRSMGSTTASRGGDVVDYESGGAEIRSRMGGNQDPNRGYYSTQPNMPSDGYRQQQQQVPMYNQSRQQQQQQLQPVMNTSPTRYPPSRTTPYQQQQQTGASSFGSGGSHHSGGSGSNSGNNIHQHHHGGGGGTSTMNLLVDDEKVASLVAMDFDPEQVVAALLKHNNNLDEALNDLLSY